MGVLIINCLSCFIILPNVKVSLHCQDFGRGRQKTKGCVSHVKYLFEIKPNFSTRVVSTTLGYLTVQIWENYPFKNFENLFMKLHNQAFFWTFRRKLKAKKTQAEKNSSKFSKKLKQIIQKLNISPTSINFFFPQKLII